MSDFSEEVEKLMVQAEGFGDGPAKVAVLEEAASIADVHRDVPLGYKVRKQLLPACLDAGRPDLMLVTYGWCLAQCDRDPTNFDIDDILWEYRWVVSEMTTFPQITREQIEGGLADIARRYLAAGSTLRAIHLLAMNVAISLRDKPRAASAYERWKNTDRDRFADDPETERAFQADYYFFMEDYDAGFRMCDSVLRGRVKSEHFFGSDCATLLYPLWVTGRFALAEQCHKKGYRYVAWNARYIDSCGDHVEYTALVNNVPRCVRLIEKHLPVALTTKEPDDRMAFLRSVYVFAAKQLNHGTKRMRMQLPKELLHLADDAGQCDVNALAAWAKAEVTDWSAQYDARNGNDHYAKRLARCDDDIVRIPTPHTDAV